MSITIQGIPLEHAIFSFRSTTNNNESKQLDDVGYKDTVYSDTIQSVLKLAVKNKNIYAGIRYKVSYGALADGIVVHRVHLPTMTIRSSSPYDIEGMSLIVEDIRKNKAIDSIQEYVHHVRKINKRLLSSFRELEQSYLVLEKKWHASKEFIHEMYLASTKHMTRLHRMDLDSESDSDPDPASERESEDKEYS